MAAKDHELPGLARDALDPEYVAQIDRVRQFVRGAAPKPSVHQDSAPMTGGQMATLLERIVPQVGDRCAQQPRGVPRCLAAVPPKHGLWPASHVRFL